jgi:uncharacterized membrane protein YidH (DUF202 family)
LPLVIAVAGHRDLIDEDKKRLRHQVGEIFDELARSYPSSKPFQVLCGLAEGSDRLVADVALSRGAQLIACLPMERSLYEMDFHSAESRREFDELLSKANEKPRAMPLVEGNTEENVKDKDRRDLQYDALGKYLVSNCDLLVALWDGVDTGLPGGTSSVVSLQRFGPFGEHDIDPCNPLSFSDSGPVFHVLTPRQKNPAPAGDLERPQLLYHAGFNVSEQARSDYAKIFFRRANAYNEDARKVNAGHIRAHEQSRSSLMPDEARRILDEPMQGLIEQYATADSLALSYQRRTKRAFRFLIFLFGLFGVLAFELFAHGPERIQTTALLIYLGLIVIAFVVYRLVNFRDIKTRHLDYRALAEGLRLQFFWKLAGVNQPVTEYYLTKERTELDWVRDAIRRWSAGVAPLQTPNWRLVGTHWIRNQFDFFSQAAKQNKKWHLIEHFCYWALVLLVFALGISTIATHAFDLGGLRGGFHEDSFHGFSRHGLLVIIMTMLPAIAGAISAYSLKMAYSEQRRQYQRMKELYERGLFCFEKAMQIETEPNENGLRQKVVLELGQEALSENADWVLMHRERMVEMFVGG